MKIAESTQIKTDIGFRWLLLAVRNGTTQLSLLWGSYRGKGLAVVADNSEQGHRPPSVGSICAAYYTM